MSADSDEVFSIVAVAPTYRNAGTLAPLLCALDAFGLDVIVVDDGSDDGTVKILDEWMQVQGVQDAMVPMKAGAHPDVTRQTHTAAPPSDLMLTMRSGPHPDPPPDYRERGQNMPSARSHAGGVLRNARWVIRHGQNRGKAVALRSGFARAMELGYTHALTIDTDGQHDPADMPGLIELARKNPGSLLLGTRSASAAGYPIASRIGRWISNFCIWIESNATVSDSQCGLRIYPLISTSRAGATAGRYAFETEIITRMAWGGVSIIQAPVRCIYHAPAQRISHFRPLRDSLQASRLHAWLMLRSFHPWGPEKLVDDAHATGTGTIGRRLLRWMNPLHDWRQLRRRPAHRRRMAASIGVGMFMATIPLYGLKTIVCLLLARQWRLQPLVVLAVSSLNTPPTGAILAAISIATGHLMLHGSLPTLSRYDPSRIGFAAAFKMVAAEWIIGGIAAGLVLGVIAYALARVVMMGIPTHKAESAAEAPTPGPII